MVGLSAEEQFRRRARKALAAGEPFEARGEVNKRLLEEVRAEVEQGKAIIRDQASKGVKRIRQASAKEEARLKERLKAEEARLKDQLKAEGAAQQRLLVEKAASLAASSGSPPLSTAGGSEGSSGSSGGGVTPEALTEKPGAAPMGSKTAAHVAMPPGMPSRRSEGMSETLAPATVREPAVSTSSGRPEGMHCAAPALDAAGDDEDMGVASPPAEGSHALTEETRSGAEDETTLYQQIGLPTSTDQRTLPPRTMQTLAIHSPGEAWRLECEARNRDYALQCEAEEARRVAAEEERARLAPEELRHFRQTYERLAAQHAWPELPEGPALPGQIANSVAWFFRVSPEFRASLYAKMKSAMPKKGVKTKCFGCQGNVEKLRGAPHTDPCAPGSWDVACARHKVLSAVDETRLEVALQMEWAEQALQFAVASQQRAAEQAERLRLASMAREAAARQEKNRRRAVEDQARMELNPRASKCRKCEDADFRSGGLCTDHEQELQLIEARLNEESVVPLSGSAAESSDSE